MTRWRYLVQRALTGEMLHTELPFTRDRMRWELSAAGALSGFLAPDLGGGLAQDGRPLLEEWSSLIYAEADGIIRWGGIVVSSNYAGQQWNVEAAGFATYPHGIPYTSSFSAIEMDPAEIIERIWGHIQDRDDGNLGVVVTGNRTKVRLGTPAKGEDEAEPYELRWWDAPDLGSEIDSLAEATPLDYIERHYWDGDDIRHEIDLGWPRHGRRRFDLSFIHGDNVTAIDPPQRDGDEFANVVMGIGAGEGKGSVRRQTAISDGRLRRPFVYTAKDVTSDARLDGHIRAELAQRQQPLTIPSITVRDHPNAVIGSWELGDDILVQATVPWLGDVSIWHRIVGWELLTEHTATLTLARSDTFTYGG